MNSSEFSSFVKNATFNGEPLVDRTEETHISWIAFSKDYVFKIKKPVKLSFLDFSTLELRKKFCNRELELNQRFSKIYLDVLPVKKWKNGWSLGQGEGDTVDYALRMKRLDSSKRMDKMLGENKVSEASMQVLAEEVADFHLKAEIIYTPFDMDKAKSLFNDIRNCLDFTDQTIGAEWKDIILRSMAWSDHFLERHAQRIQARIDKGYQRDLHGDLHGANIFLYDPPILFDCIEFSDDYRQIDLLYEIAFLCMELEAGGHKELSINFFMHYSQLILCIENREDKALYRYFKCLRANIRAKVLALREINSSYKGNLPNNKESIKNYLGMMSKYMDESEK